MPISVSRIAFGMLEDLVAFGGSDAAPADVRGVIASNQLRRAGLVDLVDASFQVTSLGRYVAAYAASQREQDVIHVETPSHEAVEEFLKSSRPGSDRWSDQPPSTAT
jgi:hypothetical protein